MITQLGQVMLYVTNQDEARDFWTHIMQFEVREDVSANGMRQIVLAPKGAATAIVLHDAAIVEKMSPGVPLSTPSLLFETLDIEALQARLTEAGSIVGELMEMPAGRVCNFTDNEGNHFAVVEKYPNMSYG